MACNGHNHSPYCNCGWGGENYGNDIGNNAYNQVLSSLSQNIYSYLQIETYESFTVPNVKCKCCGDEIFFYQSPYGGKVFFNELGHPWEKHCCEPQCCGKEIGNISHETLDKSQIINSRKEPIWKQEGWTPALYIKEEDYEQSIIKLTLKAMNNNEEYSLFVQKKQFSFLEMKEGLAINVKPIDKTLFEISFYLDDRDKTYIIFATKSSNFNNLEEFTIVSDSLNLVRRNNLTNIKLAEVFFQILNISDKYQSQKEQIYNLVLNNNNSIKSGMWRVYTYIYKHGITEFEKDLLKHFESYNKIAIHILLLLINMNTTMSLNKVQKIILNKWNQKGWELFFYKENKGCDISINEIVLNSAEDNQKYSYYIQNKYINSEIKEGIPIFLKMLNERFFEILFYDENTNEHKVIISKCPSNYELNIFIFIKTSLELITQENIENRQLVEMFFRILNIPDTYKKEKKQLNDFIINHPISKKTGMSDIYVDVNKFGIEEFEKKLLDKLNKFEFYDDEIINILASLNKVPSLMNISISILKYQNEQIEKWDSLYIKPIVTSKQKNISKRRKNNKTILKTNEEEQNILKKKKDKSNLRANRDGWKGITPYKSKNKNLTFLKKDSK